jgi:hypothetical protein
LEQAGKLAMKIGLAASVSALIAKAHFSSTVDIGLGRYGSDPEAAS